MLWDRKVDGGFPETKELKRRVRDVISPERDLGHVDRDYGKKGGDVQGEKVGEKTVEKKEEETTAGGGKGCEDCK